MVAGSLRKALVIDRKFASRDWGTRSSAVRCSLMAVRNAGNESAFARCVVIAISIVGLAAVLWLSRGVLLLAFASILLAVAARGLSEPLARLTHLGSRLSLALVAIVLCGALVGGGWFFGTQFAAELANLSKGLQEAWQRLQSLASQTAFGELAIQEIEAYASGDAIPVLSAIGSVGGWTLSLGRAFTDCILVLFAAAFLALSPEVYRDGALRFVPASSREQVSGALTASGMALRRWLLGSLVSMAVVSIALGVGLWLLGVPAFVALALIAGIAQFVPVVGPLFATIPGLLLALTVSPETALWAAILYFVVSQLEANALYPIIQERAVSVPPALSLFAILLMGVLFGPSGVVLAMPVLVVVATFVNRLMLDDKPSSKVSTDA